MERVRDLVTGGGQRDLMAAFEGLIHPRETILRFGAPRVVLTEDPKAELDALFEHYVRHGFAKDANYEARLEKKVRESLKGLNLPAPFKTRKLGTDVYSVQFPLVQMINDRAAKAIKPLYLGLKTPNAIYDHADRWSVKLKRLEHFGLKPEKVLFAIQGPRPGDSTDAKKRHFAFQEVQEDLAQYAEIVLDQDHDSRQAIRDFAIQ